MGVDFRYPHKVSRIFLFQLGDHVHRIESFLYRWSCKNCSTSFRHYPPGILPYKRYTLLQMAQMVRIYIECDEVTYASLVNPSLHAVAYSGENIASAVSSESLKESEYTIHLSASTLHRWVAVLCMLGSRLMKTIERALRDTDQVDFTPWQINPYKYCSVSRRRQLVTAAAVLLALLSLLDFSPSLEQVIGAGGQNLPP